MNESRSPELPSNVSQVLQELRDADQKDNQDAAEKAGRKDWWANEEVRKWKYTRNLERLEKAKDIVSSGQLKTYDDYHNAALIFHHAHGQEAKDMAVELAQKSLELGKPPYESLYPHAVDRKLITDQLSEGVAHGEQTIRYGSHTLDPDEQGRTRFFKKDGLATKEELDKFGIPDTDELNGVSQEVYRQVRKASLDKAKKLWEEQK